MNHRESRNGNNHSSHAASRRDHDVARQTAPGKRTLTMGLSARPSAGAGPAQRKPQGSGATPARGQGHAVEDWMRVAMRPDLYETPLLRESMDEIGYAGAGPHAAPASTGGAPMPAPVQAKMEHAFGADFSAVRVHEGPQAEAMGALAYTQGTDIHFAPGQYAPGSQRGQELLGHELTHVVQQAQGRVSTPAQGKGGVINEDPSLEREADQLGARAARGEQVSRSPAPARPTVQAQIVQRVKIPIPSEEKPARWEIVDITSEDQLPRLKSILETFYKSDPQQTTRRGFEKKVRSSVVSAIMGKKEDPDVIQKVWNMAQSVIASPHEADPDIHAELPAAWTGESGRRERSEKKKQIGTDVVLDEEWKRGAVKAMTAMCERLGVEYLENGEIQERIALAVHLLCTQGTETGDAWYVRFFEEALGHVERIPSELQESGKLRLTDQLERVGRSKLVPAALPAFRGALAEIIDCLRSAATNPRLRSISMGGKKKPLGKEHYLGVEGGHRDEVDVDRTEILDDGSKWYIEVKANVSAALHHMDNIGQLDRLQSVVRQRDANSRSATERQMAISIVCPDEWGWLFIRPCAQLYAQRGMHLMIGGVTFSPDELKKIEGQIPPKGSTKRFPKRMLQHFPAPGALKAQGCVFTLLQLARFATPPGSRESKLDTTPSESGESRTDTF